MSPSSKDVLASLSAIQQARASAAIDPEVPLTRAMQGETTALTDVTALMEAQTAAIQEALNAIERNPDEMTPSQLLELQFQMNLFSQLMETAANVLSAMNDTITAMARNIK